MCLDRLGVQDQWGLDSYRLGMSPRPALRSTARTADRRHGHCGEILLDLEAQADHPKHPDDHAALMALLR